MNPFFLLRYILPILPGKSRILVKFDGQIVEIAKSGIFIWPGPIKSNTGHPGGL